MKRILHITTHLGGGVGKVISDLTIYEKNNNSDIHQIILLEKPENEFFVKKIESSDIKISVCNDVDKISQKIKNSDIVILHWWHHPLMAKFLYNFPQTKTRLIIWVHISGCTYPIVQQSFLEKAHHILFATPYSYENPFWNNKNTIMSKSDVVYGLGKIETPNIVHKENDNLTIGYLGTLNFSKLHPNYVKFCKNVIKDFPNVKFVMVGNANETLKKDIINSKLEKNFEFTGYVNDIYSQLKRFDIFAYFLNPYHFGATENALLEAMAYKIPVITLNQSVEKHIIKNMETGILIENENNFSDAVKLLIKNKKLKEKLTTNAGNYIKNTFSFENNVEKLNKILEKVYKEEKKLFSFNDIFGNTPHEWFLAGIGKEKEEFLDFINNDIPIKNLEPIFKENNKSSIKHFYRYFSDDTIIKKLYDFIQ